MSQQNKTTRVFYISLKLNIRILVIEVFEFTLNNASKNML